MILQQDLPDTLEPPRPRLGRMSALGGKRTFDKNSLAAHFKDDAHDLTLRPRQGDEPVPPATRFLLPYSDIASSLLEQMHFWRKWPLDMSRDNV